MAYTVGVASVVMPTTSWTGVTQVRKRCMMPKAVAEEVVEGKKGAKKAAAKKAAAKPEVKEEGAKRGPMGQPEFDSLSVLVDGKKVSHNDIAAVTGRTKGNCLRELEEAGHITKSKVEGTRGYVFQVTPAGKAAYNEAKKQGMSTNYKS